MCKEALSCVLLLAALGGCARSQSFRVVDAQTGEPVRDVWVSQGGSPSSAYTLKTDPSGTVQFQKSGSQFSLSKAGYEEARVEVKGSLAWVRSASDPQGLEVKKYGDLVQVPLRRRDSAAGAKPEPRTLNPDLSPVGRVSNSSYPRTLNPDLSPVGRVSNSSYP